MKTIAEQLNNLEREELARILMKRIIHFIDRVNPADAKYQYVKPHLKVRGDDLLNIFLNNLSEDKRN